MYSKEEKYFAICRHTSCIIYRIHICSWIAFLVNITRSVKLRSARICEQFSRLWRKIYSNNGQRKDNVRPAYILRPFVRWWRRDLRIFLGMGVRRRQCAIDKLLVL